MLKNLMLSNQMMAAEPVPAARLGRVHFAGIGGAGMSGIARIMLARGIRVSGSDARDSALLGELRELGASVHVGHAPGHLRHLGPGDTLAVSSALRAGNPGLADIQAAFTTFGLRVSGIVLTCADDPGAEAVAARLDPVRVRRYGESRHADYRLTDVTSRGMAISFTVAADHGPFGEIFTQMTVDVPGHHNALNATAAFAAAIELGFAPPRVAAAIAGYRGARRRMELKGEARGVRVLDSYAHHPTELAADLRAARDITQHAGQGRVIAIFQPHLFSRTRIFAAEFGAALGLADEAIVLDVYAAREDPEPGVTGQLIVDAVPGGHARFMPDPARVAALIDAIAEPGDLVLTMGAGDITPPGPRLVGRLGGSRE